MTTSPRAWGIPLLILLTAILIAGCTDGGSSVVDNAIAWISGWVTKSRGEPIANATVTLNETGQSSTTNSEGWFRIGTTYRGAGTLRTEASGYLTLEWPVGITRSGIGDQRLRLVTMADYSDALFQELTGATDTIGTWRWENGLVSYYIDRSGAYQSAFDAPLREGFTQWSMLTRRAITFVEGGSSSEIQINFVWDSPCGVSGAAGCAGATSVSADGVMQGGLIELDAAYATDVGLAAHEMGHLLYFGGHSDNPTDLMYFAMNGATAPSNREAAVAAVLYTNPPGATMTEIRLPAAQYPAAALAVPALSPAASASAVAPPSLTALPSPAALSAPAVPGLGALDQIGAMIRAWFGATGCALNLPLLCPAGPVLQRW